MTNPTKKKNAPPAAPEQGSSRRRPTPAAGSGAGGGETGQSASKQARRAGPGRGGGGGGGGADSNSNSSSRWGEITAASGLDLSPSTIVSDGTATASATPLPPIPAASAVVVAGVKSSELSDLERDGRPVVVPGRADSVESSDLEVPAADLASARRSVAPHRPAALSAHVRREELGPAVELEAMQGGTSSAAVMSPPKLDWVWSEDSVSEACMHVMGRQGAQVFFHQDYSCGTAAARGTLPMAEGQHFWEIHMDSPVYGTAMMLGIGTKQIDLGQYMHTFCHMLGSDANAESCGLSYTGRFFQGGANGRAYCSKFGQGTVIGLHLDMWFGTLTYYKNGKCLGVATKGLLGKAWYPMVSSTAARSSMCLQAARSFPSSLQFWCCRSLRRAVPAERSVLAALPFPPGLRAFLEDNLGWLLEAQARPQADLASRGTQTELSMATHRVDADALARTAAVATAGITAAPRCSTETPSEPSSATSES